MKTINYNYSAVDPDIAIMLLADLLMRLELLAQEYPDDAPDIRLSGALLALWGLE